MKKYFLGAHLPLDFSLTIEIQTPGAQAMGAPRKAGVAQSVEQLICNQQVAGSSPISSSRKRHWEGFPSGQREQTVNLSAKPSEVRILPPPP